MILYLLKANICLSIFVTIYWILLRNNTFYKINRIYLLSVILISIILPVLNLSGFVNQHQEITQIAIVKQLPDLNLLSHNQNITSKLIQNSISINPSIPLDVEDIFRAVFMAGMFILLCKLIVQLISILTVLRKSNPININGIKVQNLTESIIPFSFFKLIFINVNQHSERDLSEIIAHEYAHAKAYHSVDVMLVELFCAVFWFNPLAWTLRKLLKQNLEFLTDKTVLESGFDAKNYQYNLLKINGLNVYNMTNSFNLSDLKLRIMMMNRKRSSKVHLLKYCLMIPIGALVILAFNISKAKTFDTQKSVFQNLKETVKAVEFVRNVGHEITSLSERENILNNYTIQPENTNFSSYSIQKIIKDSTDKLYSHLFYDIRITDKETHRSIEGVKIFNDKGQLIGTTNFQGIYLFDYARLKVYPADSVLKCDSKSHVIIFQYQNFPKVRFEFSYFKKSVHLTFDKNKFELEPEQEYSKDYSAIIKRIPDAVIDIKSKSITILPSDGSVWIEPKTKWFYCKEDIIKELKQTQELPFEKRPQYLINGTKVAGDYQWDNISIHSLVSLSYWKPEDGELMKGKYGEQAKNGMYDLMVLEKSKVAVNAPKYDFEPVMKDLSKVERCTPSVDFPANALYIIDGKEVDSGFLHKNIKLENIENLEVMNQEIARTKYGEKGKKGVILISTKKNDKLH